MYDLKILSLVLVSILSNICYAMVVPFLPVEMKKFGIQEHLFGYIFGIYALASMIGSLFVGKLLVKFGRKIILILGILSMGTTMVSFALISYIHNLPALIFACLMIRCLQGLSSSMIQTTAYAIVTACYPDEQQKYLSIIETSIGVGCVAGPLAGSLVYAMLGFQNTFYCTGLLFLFLAPVLYNVIPKTIDAKDSSSSKESPNRSSFVVEDTEEVSYSVLFLNSRFLINCMAALLSYFHVCYLEPIFSMRVLEFDVQTVWVSLIYGFGSIGYVVVSLGMAQLNEKFQNRTLIAWGTIICAIGQLLSGPSHFLPDQLWILAVGWFLVCGFAAMMTIPALPEMSTVACKIYPDKKYEASDLSSGAFNSMLGLGQMLGPLYGSYVTALFDYKICCTSVGILLIVFFGLYYIVEFNQQNEASLVKVETEMKNQSLSLNRSSERLL